jgi:hypothetical protein
MAVLYNEMLIKQLWKEHIDPLSRSFAPPPPPPPFF